MTFDLFLAIGDHAEDAVAGEASLYPGPLKSPSTRLYNVAGAD